MSKIDTSELQRIITGRVLPHIYSFVTNTLPNYLKVGDTYRPVEERLNEWRKHYKDLKEVSRHVASINSEVFFRDYAVHKYLRQQGILQVSLDASINVHSDEFFEGAKKSDISKAVDDIATNYQKTDTYDYYTNFKELVEFHYNRTQDFRPRPIQQQALDEFNVAVKKGRNNLLMFAVMRFGKSITAIWAAKNINAKLTVVVSAKADVLSEWKQTVESHKDFSGYRFMDRNDLKEGMNWSDFYGKMFTTGSGDKEICNNIVLFLTLQDLAGSSEVVKSHHKILQGAKVDLLVIDETHFGARASVLGKILAGVEIDEVEKNYLKKDKEDPEDLGSLDKLEAINAGIKLHLSGTPYRILMGSEFAEEDIIAFVQFSDIYKAKLDWGSDNLDKDEWKNPYYGFPQMIRFAFNPNKSSLRRLDDIRGSKPAILLTPTNLKNGRGSNKFLYEREVIDLLRVLDGSKNDTNMLGLLDNEVIKEGKLARHIVMVLPYRASCDALEELIKRNKKSFKNIAEYTIFNISGHNRKLNKPEDIKVAIQKEESVKKKTITLTVNKMLTGSTVPQWDTMIYLKGTVSPQEYDQAIFRLQSPWVETYQGEEGRIVKHDMKPQTLLIDLDPTRLFYLQELKAFTYGANTQKSGNENIEAFIQTELSISPIITLNAEGDRLVEVTPTNIIDQARKYASDRTIIEDVQEIDVDVSLKDNPAILEVISKLAELGGKGGLNIRPNQEEGEELDSIFPDVDVEEAGDVRILATRDTGITKDMSSFEKRFRTYYVMIILFAFLSNTEEKSLTDVLENIEANEDNRRIARNLGLRKSHLMLIREKINPRILTRLDYKIQNADFRTYDDTITPVDHIEIAVHKFARLSDAEVFTPSLIVNKIYTAFGRDFWRNVKETKVLDIASKSGVFAKGFLEKAAQYGVDLEDIKNNFYSIPTSPAAYEFTRKMYQTLGLNTDNIARHFSSFDLLKLNHNQVRYLLSRNKKFCEISLSDLEGYTDIDGNDKESMKFTAIVGNPPYQGENHQQIYPHFYLASRALGARVSLIFPTGWQEPKNGNNLRLLNSKEVKEDPQIVYIDNRQNIFPGIAGAEWTNIILWKRGYNNGLNGRQKIYTNGVHPQEVQLVTERNHNHKPKQVREMARIVTAVDGFVPMQSITSALKPYGLRTDVIKDPAKYSLPQIHEKRRNKDDIKLYATSGKSYYVDKNYPLPRKTKSFGTFKIFVPYAWGNMDEKAGLGGAYSDIIIGRPHEISTETYQEQGPFETITDAKKHAKFLMTKFARALLYINKHSQHSTTAWGAVPVQDYCEAWWDKSINEIDNALMKKYKIPSKIKDFVMENIQIKSERNITGYFD